MTNEFRRRSKLQQFHFEAKSKGSPAVKTCQFSDECIASHKCVCVCVCESVCVCVCVCVDVSFDGALKSQRFSSNLQKWRVALRIRHVCRLPALSLVRRPLPLPPAPGLLAWLDALRHVSQRGWGWVAASRARRQVKHYNITRFPIHLWKSFSLLTSFSAAALQQRDDFPFYYLQYPFQISRRGVYGTAVVLQGTCLPWHTRHRYQHRVLRALSFCFFSRMSNLPCQTLEQTWQALATAAAYRKCRHVFMKTEEKLRTAKWYVVGLERRVGRKVTPQRHQRA